MAADLDGAGATTIEVEQAGVEDEYFPSTACRRWKVSAAEAVAKT